MTFDTFLITFLQILSPDVTGQETPMRQQESAAQTPILVECLRVTAMKMKNAQITLCVDLIIVLISSHLLPTVVLNLKSTYRILKNSFRGNYSFFNWALCTVTFGDST